MKLVAYVIDGHPFEIRPAPLSATGWKRPMSASPIAVCLSTSPMLLAGRYCVPKPLAPYGTAARPLESVQVSTSSIDTAPAVSHFGYGTLTFHVLCLFRTDPGVELIAQGPINRPKDGIAPLHRRD